MFVANGDRVPSSGVCPNLAINIHEKAFSVDLYVISLDGYDAILGYDWMRTLGPILWDLSMLSMFFWRHDHVVYWQGITEEAMPRLSIARVDNPLTALLAAFEDLFAMSSGLPLPWPFDHRIHLLPNTPPVAVRPYRYAQLLKDEIEAQCKAMLEQGIIRLNTSVFSSLVLLVRKRDGSWRFCVDYRALTP